MKTLQSFILGALAGMTTGADFTYLPQPSQRWISQVPPLDVGNEVKESPDESIICATSKDATISCLTKAGSPIWKDTPPPYDGNNPFSKSGVDFSLNTPNSFMVYGASFGITGTATVFCRVIAYDYGGAMLWESETMDGECAGTPLIGLGGDYVYLTRNQPNVGYFTVLDGNDGSFVYNDFSQPQPFTPPGIYRNPDEGYYSGGEDKRQDVLVWSHAPFPNEQGVGIGGLFAFQKAFPTFPDAVVHMRTDDKIDWQATAAPVITNKGYSMYVTVARNQYRAWVGSIGDNMNKLDRNALYKSDFRRANPAWQGGATSVVLSNDGPEPMVFVGTAENLFAAFDYTLNDDGDAQNQNGFKWTKETLRPINAEPRVSPDESRVFWENGAGSLTCANTEDGTTIWGPLNVHPNGIRINADFALSAKGDYLYMGDISGSIFAWQIAEGGATSEPTTSPSTMPSVAPSPLPSEVTTPEPTLMPVTPAPTEMGATPEPTMAPVEPETPEPTEEPTDSPVAEATDEPTAAGVGPAEMTAEPTEAGPTSAATKASFTGGVVMIVIAMLM